MDAVVIESAALVDDELAKVAVVTTCSSMLSAGTCAVGSVTGGVIRAEVTLEETGAARIAFHRAGAVGEVTQRTLRFGAADALGERWRSVGLVIGTVSEGLLRSPAMTAEPAPTMVRPPLVLRPPPAVQAPALRARTEPDDAERPFGKLWIDAGLVTGPALDDGSWRLGALLTASHALGDSPIAAGVALRYAIRPEDAAGVEVGWLSGGLTLAARLPLAQRRVWVQPRVELLADQMSASVTDPTTRRSDDASLWSVGARLGADVAWMPTPTLGVWIGAEVTALQAGIAIRVGGDEAARLAPFAGGLSLGGRAALF